MNDDMNDDMNNDMNDGNDDDMISRSVNQAGEPMPAAADARLRASLDAALAGGAQPGRGDRSARQAAQRRNVLLASAAAVVLVAGVAVVVLANRDSSHSMSGTPVTVDSAPSSPLPTTTSGLPTDPTAPATTGTDASTTSTSTSTSTSSSTTTTLPAAIVDGWNPACVESFAVGESSSSSAVPGDVFAPLGDSPSIVIDLPLGKAPDSADAEPAAPDVVAVAGGFLVSVRPSSYGTFAGTILAVVNTDGTTRWVRCIDRYVGAIYASASPKATDALVNTRLDITSETAGSDWGLLSLADGMFGAMLDERVSAAGIDPVNIANPQPYASGVDRVLLGPFSQTVPIANDRLVSVDLTTMAVSEVPFPQQALATDVFQLRFDVAGTGEPLYEVGNGAHPPVVAVFSNGAWSTDAATIEAAAPVSVEFDLLGNLLTRRDPAGNVLWQDADLSGPLTEGFHSAVDGDVTVVNACHGTDDQNPNDAGECLDPVTAGIENATGTVLWQLDGQRSVSLVADGYALVSEASVTATDGSVDEGAWSMIDTTTGQAVPGQRWDDPDTFRSACCGDGEFTWTAFVGGAVVATDGTHMHIWYPEAVSMPTVTVSFG